MADPIDYSGAFGAASPFQSFIQGVQGANVVADSRFAQQEQSFKMQQQQAAIAQQQRMQADLASLGNNPSPQDIGRMSVKYPQLSESFKRSYDMLSPEAQQQKLQLVSSVASALHTDNPDIAVDILNKQAEAFANSGDEKQAEASRIQAQMVKDHPEFAKTNAFMLLGGLPNGEKVIDGIAKLGGEARANAQAPAELAKKQADAAKAGAEATVAGATIPDMIAKPAQDARLAEFDAQIKAANSETQRGQLTLERDKYMQDQVKLAGTTGSAQQDQLDSVGNAISTAQGLLNDPELKKEWTGVGSTLGKLLSNIPGTESKDYRANVQTLKSQLFLPAVAALKAAGAGGALSDAEGKKLDSQVASLDPDMSPKAFSTNLRVVIASLTKAQQKVLANPKTPQKGGAYVATNPTYGNITEGDINRLMKNHPGATRQQVMEFLNQGAK
jgi:hypothetical protein